MKRGTIVLTIFPFTDLTALKRRPAIVVSGNNESKEDVIVAYISSVLTAELSETDLVFDEARPDFFQSGLKKKSVIKLDKIATLKKAIFTGELGIINQDTLSEIDIKLKLALGFK